MTEVNVTQVLRDTIKSYRKELNIRGDDLSRRLKKDTSFISRLETGKIETITTNLLYKIFDELFPNAEDKNKKINETLNQMKLTLSDNELEYQQWLTIVDLQYRLLPIPDTIIDYIQSSLKDLNISSTELISIVNQNSDLTSELSQKEIDDMEDNKVYPVFKKMNDDSLCYIVGMHIKFNLVDNFIDDILDKKLKRCNFVTMQGILYNILKLKGIEDKEALKQSEQILFDNKFYTLMRKQYLTRHKLSDKLADYDIDFNKKLKKLTLVLNSINDKQPNFLNKILNGLIENIYNEPSLTFSIIGRSLKDLHEIPISEKKLFMKDFDKLVKEYSTHTEDEDKIETF